MTAPDTYYAIDTGVWPQAGLPLLSWIKNNTNVSIVSFYLGPAPSHYEDDYMPHLSALQNMGFGLIPIYVGQQLYGPGSHIMTANQGDIDGANAVALMIKAGFPAGSTVWLDHEEGAPLEPSRIAYDNAFMAAVADNGYSTGIYCSHAMGEDVFVQLTPPLLWCFDVPTVSASFYTSKNISAYTSSAAQGTKVDAATGWQFRDNVIWAPPGMPGKRLRVDFNLFNIPDPSAPPFG